MPKPPSEGSQGVSTSPTTNKQPRGRGRPRGRPATSGTIKNVPMANPSIIPNPTKFEMVNSVIVEDEFMSESEMMEFQEPVNCGTPITDSFQTTDNCNSNNSTTLGNLRGIFLLVQSLTR